MALTILFKGKGWTPKFSGNNRRLSRKEVLTTAKESYAEHKREIKKEKESAKQLIIDLGKKDK